MATVPTLKGPTVDAKPLTPVYQSTNVDVSAFGGGLANGLKAVGSGLNNLSDNLDNIFLDKIKQDNERQAKDLDNQFTEGLRKIYQGDGTAQNPGYYSNRGENALTAYGSTQQAVNDLRAKLTGSTQNRAIQQMFDKVASSRVNDAFDTQARFASAQRTDANDTTSAARVVNAKNSASDRWNDPAFLLQQIGIGKSEGISQAQNRGITDPDAVNAIIQGNTTNIVRGAIDGAIASGDLVSARKIYEGSGNAIAGYAKPDIEQQFKTAQRAADQEVEHKMVMAEHQHNLHQQAVADDLFHRMVTDPTSITPKFIDQSDLDPNVKEHWLEMMDKQTKDLQTDSQKQANQDVEDTLLSDFYSTDRSSKVTHERIDATSLSPATKRTYHDLLDNRNNDSGPGKEARTATENQLLVDSVRNPTSITPDRIVDSNLLPDQKSTWLTKIEQDQKKALVFKDDPDVIDVLRTQINLPDGDPNKLSDPNKVDDLYGHGLTLNTVRLLKNEIKTANADDTKAESSLKQQFIDGAKQTLSGKNDLLNTKDPKGQELFTNFLTKFYKDYADQRKAGKTPAQLLNSDSPDYLGKDLSVMKRPLSVQIKDMIEAGSDVGGLNSEFSGNFPAPTSAQINFLKSNKTNPKAISDFEEKFGPGSAQKAIGE